MNQISTPTPASLQDFIWLFFRFTGRINREVYWLGFGLSFVISRFTLQPYLSNLETVEDLQNIPMIAYLISIVLMWAELALAAKRAHDKSMSGFIAILVIVPVLNFAVLLFLGLIPGDPGPNKYGRQPNGRS